MEKKQRQQPRARRVVSTAFPDNEIKLIRLALWERSITKMLWGAGRLSWLTWKVRSAGLVTARCSLWCCGEVSGGGLATIERESLCYYSFGHEDIRENVAPPHASLFTCQQTLVWAELKDELLELLHLRIKEGKPQDSLQILNERTCARPLSPASCKPFFRQHFYSQDFIYLCKKQVMVIGGVCITTASESSGKPSKNPGTWKSNLY